MPTKQIGKIAGFTIVETIIVLGVASLILLLVLGAIPALQRNSRNNERKQDVQAILEAVSHWELNNSGTIPSTSDNFLQYTQLHAYDAPNVQVHARLNTDRSSVPLATSVDNVDIYNREKCISSSAASWQGAGYYDVVAIYAIEAGNSLASQCQQL